MLPISRQELHASPRPRVLGVWMPPVTLDLGQKKLHAQIEAGEYSRAKIHEKQSSSSSILLTPSPVPGRDRWSPRGRTFCPNLSSCTSF